MNFTNFSRFSRGVLRNLKNYTFKQNSQVKSKPFDHVKRAVIRGQENSESFSSTAFHQPIGLLIGFSFFKKHEETPEEQLITIIKRSVLAIQRKEYDKAEQTLHLALRMAQDLKSKDGVTYVYDVLANLAMERGQYVKAEKLFVDVMKRLFADGKNEYNIKVLYINSKMAHMAHLQDELVKAAQGFRWTLSKIEENLKKQPDSEEYKELKAITSDWYGQMLIDQQKYSEARKYFLEAYDILRASYGETYAELVPILNNLSVAALGMNNTTAAKEYLMSALEILKSIPDTTIEGILQANLGLIYLRDGLLQQAKTTCSYAYKLGKKMKDRESIEQADYCLSEIQKVITRD